MPSPVVYGEELLLGGTIQLKWARLAGDIRSERAMGFEPTTSSLGSWHSTAELRPRLPVTLAYHNHSGSLVGYCALLFLILAARFPWSKLHLSTTCRSAEK